jgi:peptide deformylase
MAILDIISIPDPLLREVSKPIEQIDARHDKLIDQMFETMYEAPGIGLAAVQVALPVRLIVMDCGDPKDEIEREAELEKWEEEVALAEEEGRDPPERPARKPTTKKPMVLINPKIVDFSDEVSVYNEGCLSIPEYFADVERPAGCTVEFLDREGKKQTLAATGLLSTCIQHEVDHLNGTLFIDHISKLKREMVVKKFTKIAKQSGREPAKTLVI